MSETASERLARRIVALFGGAEAEVFRELARLLARGIEQPRWGEMRLAEQHVLERRIRRIVDRLGKAVPGEVSAAIASAVASGERAALREVAAVGGARPVPFSLLPQTAALAALEAELSGALSSTYLRILRSSEDVYRSVIAESVSESLAAPYTRRAISQAALDRFAMRGVSGFVDRAGRSWSLASYTEMATRTTLSHAALEARGRTYAEQGYDLVRVSDAPGECEMCRPWEGRILSLTGATEGHATLDQARASGLFHRNCRHSYGLYVPGLSKPMDRRTADPAGEPARTKQRYLERGIRSWKLREAAALDDPARRYAHAKVREWQAKLREHIDATGGKRLSYREQVTRAI